MEKKRTPLPLAATKGEKKGAIQSAGMELRMAKELGKKDWKAAKALMSFFRRPITNKKPEPVPLSLILVYGYVISEMAKETTVHLRTITDRSAARQYKGGNFDYITPGGLFTYCADDRLVKPSDILCVDLDYLGSRVEELFAALIADPQFETLLLFRSPSGFGLKWFVEIDLTKCDYKMWYTAVRNYLMTTYHLSDDQVDKHCGNISRACYLGYDPAAYINPELLDNI